MAPTALVDNTPAQQFTFGEKAQFNTQHATYDAPLTPPTDAGNKMDDVSDAVDAVNVYLGQHKDAPRPKDDVDDSWKHEKSKFDQEKDKAKFRDYENAMDSVKVFYKEQHAKQ